ncbi:hypothetical protein GOC46_29010 [Sinorhizobium meliloti]|nr:hypothetical protein [Sinorhizobium meliloti]MDX0384169.1 hypothetical protein [Sinorhizobium meliloti]
MIQSGLRDLQGTDDARTARLLGFGGALRAPECRRRPSGEAQQHHFLVCVREAVGQALKRSDGSKGGRRPFPAVLMLKILVLQALYNLSDDQAEFVIQDRLSFMRFLGLGLSDKVPDAKTIWLFRESLVRAGAIDSLFARFDKHLSRSGYLAKGGQIVDATIIQAPKQHNSQDEIEAIKAGEIPEDWKDKPAKLAQKDRDARWTVKYSKAKQPTETPTQPRPSSMTSPFRCSVTKTMPASTGRMGSSRDGR